MSKAKCNAPEKAEKEQLILSFSLSNNGIPLITVHRTVVVSYPPEAESPSSVFARIQPDNNPASLLWCGYGESKPEAISKALLAYMGEGESHNLIEGYRLGQIDDEAVAAWLQVPVKIVKSLLLGI